MARQIKNFWLKIGTMFMTLYFMPLSHFIMSMLGRNASDANAGTVYCTMSGSPAGSGPKIECDGVTSKTIYTGSSVMCPCPDDTTKIQEWFCGTVSEEVWNPDCSCMEGRTSAFFMGNVCEPKPGSCSPNGSTKDCSSESQYGTRTCTNGMWGSCVLGNCKNGYIKIGSVCKALCQIENGTGYEYEEESSSSSSSTEA